MIKSGDYQYILLTDGTAELTNYTAYAEFLTVPAQIDGHAVASIGSEAFINSEFLSSIILPDCLTTIGIDAFCGCSFLTSITLPNSLTTIGNWAFKSCPVSLNFTAVRGFLGGKLVQGEWEELYLFQLNRLTEQLRIKNASRPTMLRDAKLFWGCGRQGYRLHHQPASVVFSAFLL